jgi:polysaccharide export outer membrane protein
MRYLKSKCLVIAFFILAFFGTSCLNSKKYVYFSDLQQASGEELMVNRPSIKIEPGDILQITVSTIDRDISQLLNPTTNGITGVNTPVAPGYLVDSVGAIEMPLVGKVTVAGKTTTEITEIVKEAMSKSVKNVFVSTRLLNFRISILGDVARPGSYNIANERVSLLEALSMAGDLNIGAKRDNVLLIREIEGKRRYVTINLNDSKTLSSPYFYLSNKDVIYVKPSSSRLFTSSTGFQILPTIFGALSLALVIYSTFNNN